MADEDSRSESRDRQPDSDLGILFVHGIGVQSRGQTLAQFGDPLYFWIRDRCRRLDFEWGRVLGEPQPKWRSEVENELEFGRRSGPPRKRSDPEARPPEPFND